jgi:osmotically inducible protein OsmC
MPTFARKATINWKGSILEGSGEVQAGSGAFSLPVTFPKRISAEAEKGATSPEELIAAAHATCYAMVVAAALGKATPPVSMQKSTVTCTVTGEKTDAGLKILSSSLEVVAEGLQGMDAATFSKTAVEAEGKCPVSNALRGSVKIDVKASVK